MLKVTPLAPTFAAEVEGVNFLRSVPDDTFHELKDVANKYGVVIFRNAALDDHKLIAFPGCRIRIPLDEIFNVSNLNETNEIMAEKDPNCLAAKNGNATWYADGAFNPRRTGISRLRAVELPPKVLGFSCCL